MMIALKKNVITKFWWFKIAVRMRLMVRLLLLRKKIYR